MAVTTLGERASSVSGEGCHEGSSAMLAAHHMSGVSGRCNPWQREGGRAEGAWATAKPPLAEKHVVPAPGVVPVQGVVLVLGVAPSQSAAVPLLLVLLLLFLLLLLLFLLLRVPSAPFGTPL